ncbi:hypothetical protein SAMN05216223_108294 [Actinacidiphila yanglinensis]|uniref:Uncharacterized protein n=1 Tax=Actinacidiphila yanglinensis TaxID=310779 RepID=A0A1H6CCV1_9ACTN|nr:hypothetical protein [Actinacidiphila yanglinensis]SEG70728.1 hypothetical protein SAMN05216223_108294 [Actinacidiphila yanglinensis]
MDDRQVDDEQPKEQPEATPSGTPKDKPLDLSVPQVAGSAVAAVVAAKLASNLGVYGTIMGAGVVSALGTCGGSIFHYVFRRTGRHVHEVAVQARPRVTLPTLHLPTLHSGDAPSALLTKTAIQRSGGHGPDDTRARLATDPTASFDPADPDRTALLPDHASPITDPTALLPPSEPTGLLPAAEPEHLPGDVTDATRLLAATGPVPTRTGPLWQPPADGEFSAGTLHRARGRGWKRPVVAVVIAFGLAMGGITAYEATSGRSISGSGGTTVGDVFSGGGSSHHTTTPSGGDPTGTPTPSGSATRSGGDAPSRPDHPQSGAPSTAPEHSGQPTPTQTPSSPSNPGGGDGTGTGSTSGSGGGASQSPTPHSTSTATPSPGGDGLTRNPASGQDSSTSQP